MSFRQSWGRGLPRDQLIQGGTHSLAKGGGSRVAAEVGRAVRIRPQPGSPPFLSSLRFPGHGLGPAVRFREPLWVASRSHAAAVGPEGSSGRGVSCHTARWT